VKIVPFALLLILGYHLCFAEPYEVRRKIVYDDNSRFMHKTLLAAGEDANRRSMISKKQSKTHYADVMKEKWEGKDILHYQTSMGKTALRHCIHFTAEPSGCVIRDMKWKSKTSPEICYIQRGGLQTYIMIKYHTATEKRALIQFAVQEALTGEELEVVSEDGSQKLIVKEGGYCERNYD